MNGFNYGYKQVGIFILGNRVEVIIDKGQLCHLIETNHAGIMNVDVEETANLTGGHLGINKTADKISIWFYLPEIKEDISEYVKSCKWYQRVKKYKLEKKKQIWSCIQCPY